MSSSDNNRLWGFPVLSALAGPGDDREEPEPPGALPDPPEEQPEPPFRDPDDSRDKLANELDHDELANLRTDNHHKKTTASEVTDAVRGDTGTPLYLEVRTSDPSDPAPGRIWYRSDLD